MHLTPRTLSGLLLGLLLNCQITVPIARDAFLGKDSEEPFPYLLLALAGLGGSRTPVIYAATNGGVSISLDGGRTFTNSSSGLSSPVTYEIGLGPGVIYAGCPFGVFRSTNGGSSFNITANSGDIANMFVDGSNIYTGVVSVGIMISNNGGTSYSTNGVVYPRRMFAIGNTVYYAQGSLGVADGLYISTNGGGSYTQFLNGLDSQGIFVNGSTIYLATVGGLHVSTNGGSSSTQMGPVVTLYGNVFVSGNNIYLSPNTPGLGLYISRDSGNNFTNYTTANGLGSNTVRSIYVDGDTVYVSTPGGLAISTDGGNSYVNRTIANGLGATSVFEVITQ